MKYFKQLSWDDFRLSIIVAGEQRIHKISANPEIGVYWDGTDGKVGIRIPVEDKCKLPPKLHQFTFLECIVRRLKGVPILELSVRSKLLWKHFYAFACSVADRIVKTGDSPIQAVLIEIECFSQLLQENAVLGPERQIGLYGELIVLRRLLLANGPLALTSWNGPDGEPHDFRLGNVELEVKSTVGSRPIHTIHGMDQLTPSHGCKLFIMSILLGPPGKDSSSTLPSIIEEIRGLLSGVGLKERFCELLKLSGYRDQDGHQYNRGYSLRRPLQAMRVDSDFPKIDRGMLEAALGPSFARLQDIRYDLNLEGLGFEDGKPSFPKELLVRKPRSKKL